MRMQEPCCYVWWPLLLLQLSKLVSIILMLFHPEFQNPGRQLIPTTKLLRKKPRNIYVIFSCRWGQHIVELTTFTSALNYYVRCISLFGYTLLLQLIFLYYNCSIHFVRLYTYDFVCASLHTYGCRHPCHFDFYQRLLWKLFKVHIKNDVILAYHSSIKMYTGLQLVIQSVYWPIIGHLYCIK